MDGSAAGVDDVAAWLAAKCGAAVPPDARLFVLRRDGAIEGAVIFSHWFWDAGRRVDAELTIELDRPATPAIVRAALRYAFEALELDRVTVHPRHERSRLLAQLCGFRFEGVKRGTGRMIYGLTAADYRAGHFGRAAA